jgi:hypothetical protein
MSWLQALNQEFAKHWLFWVPTLAANAFLIVRIVIAIHEDRRITRQREMEEEREKWLSRLDWIKFE